MYLLGVEEVEDVWWGKHSGGFTVVFWAWRWFWSVFIVLCEKCTGLQVVELMWGGSGVSAGVLGSRKVESR